MEILGQFNVFVILLFTLAFLLSLFPASKKYRNVDQTKKLPPGPWKLPLIGNMHQLFGGLPHHILRDMAGKHGEIMHLQLGEIPVVVVSSPRLAKEFLKSHDPVFAGRPQLLAFKVLFYDGKDVASHTYDAYWRQMRSILHNEVLSTKAVRSVAPIRLDEGKRLISLAKNKAGHELFNLTEAVYGYTMSVVCRSAFGKLNRKQEGFVQLVKKTARFTSSFDFADLFPSFKTLHFVSGKMPKMLKLHNTIDNFLEDMINEHNRNLDSTKEWNGEGGKEDFIDSLLGVKNNSNLKFPVDNINIKGIIFDLFTAGTETSTTTTIWAISELMRNPRVMAKAQREIRETFLEMKSFDESSITELKYLDLVIKETFRLHPAAPLLLPRESIEDCVIDEYTIPVKTSLMVNVWAIGRDPTLWHDPESFIPERFENNSMDYMGNNFELIPFGAGKRICPGISYGLANVKLPLALLLNHFDWEFPKGIKPEDMDMTEGDGATAPKKFDLCLFPTLRSTSVDDGP